MPSTTSGSLVPAGVLGTQALGARKNAGEELPCAKQILKTIARRAFRQPITDSDVAMETLLTFYQDGRAQGNFDTGIQHAVARVLVDPRFLYRFEREPANIAAGTTY